MRYLLVNRKASPTVVYTIGKSSEGRNGLRTFFLENKGEEVMKLGIVESEPVSETLRKRTNADKA